MSRFECPACGGGFPDPAFDPASRRNVCPWCEEQIAIMNGVEMNEVSEE